MAITFELPRALQPFARGNRVVRLDGRYATVRDALEALATQRGEQLTGEEYAARFSAALEPVTYAPLTPDAYRALGFPGADDLGNMFQHHEAFNAEVCALRDVERTRRLYPGVMNFARWLEQNASRIPLD